MGQLNLQKGLWADAAMYFEMFLQKRPEEPRVSQVVESLGYAYEQMAEPELARVIYNEFIAAHPNDTRIDVIRQRLQALEGSD